MLSILIAGITINTMSQTNNDFKENWKKVDALQKKGLTKSALQEVITIYNLALKAGNDAQQIKSCMYQIMYRNMLEEDSQEKNIFFVDTLIAKAKTPAKNILQSMQAEMYWQYLQNNRWKFYDRTKLAEEKSNDISTWSIDKLYAVITSLYKASLLNNSTLKNTTLNNLDAIIIKGQNTRQLRPTLYDFLAHRALEFYMNDEEGITKPAYQFKIDDSKAFSNTVDFIDWPSKSKDTASLQYNAILLFQQLLRFHITDQNPDALIDADILRLHFVNANSIVPNKEKLFEQALLQIEKKYPTNPAIAHAMFLRGNIYLSNGQEYKPFTNEENQYEIKRAKELFESIYAKFPKSEGGIAAKNAILQIQEPQLGLQTEKVNIPLQPFRSLVKYKNIKTLYLRVIKTSREQLKLLDKSDYEKTWKAYTALKAIKNWSINLPDLQDFQEHAAEIKIDALPVGVYLVIASVQPDFTLPKNILARQLTYVSNISYIHTSQNDYYVLDRDNGMPLPNAQAQVWESVYNSNNSKYEDIKAEKYKADGNGYFKLIEGNNYRNFSLQITHGADELFLDENNYSYANNYNSYADEPVRKWTFLFTDRSIYRPGQVVYFKGIVITNEKDVIKSKIVPNFKTTLQLKDANGQKIASLLLTTNEYGSYNGKFQLPQGLLNGSFSLYDSITTASYNFNVEEYKRPKFYTEVQKPKGTYKINDSIEIIGTAKAYAGNNIDGAKVSYRVVRKVQYPIWWGWRYYRGFPNNNNDEMEITNGITQTDEKGEFKIKFKAIPDEKVDKKGQPIFYYEVSADITDLNGETRSGNTSVAVAYQALQLNIQIPESLPAGDLKNLKIHSTNLNDIFEKTNVNISITKLQSPKKIYRKRYWEMPDQFTMSKNEYVALFPYDIYKDEDIKNNWPLSEKIFDKTDSTRENAQFKIEGIKPETGWYKIIATTKDKYGEAVRAEKYIQITGGTKTDDAIKIEINKKNVEPGESINYTINTGFNKLWLIHSLTKMDKTTNLSYSSINKDVPANFAITTTDQDRGGMAMSYAFVKHNRVYNGYESFNIPWSNKDLNISYETFRDKLLPGENEKWKVKITGNKGEKVAAEMLAGMYDASLDQFKPHNWARPYIWPGLYNSIRWTGNGFTQINAEEYNGIEESYLHMPEKSYDRLLGSYAYYQGRYYGRDKFSNAQVMSAAPTMAKKELQEVVVTRELKGKVSGVNVAKDEEVKNGSIAFYLKTGSTEKNNTAEPPKVQVRKNFNETAFFFPDFKNYKIYLNSQSQKGH